MNNMSGVPQTFVPQDSQISLSLNFDSKQRSAFEAKADDLAISEIGKKTVSPETPVVSIFMEGKGYTYYKKDDYDTVMKNMGGVFKEAVAKEEDAPSILVQKPADPLPPPTEPVPPTPAGG